MFVFFQGLLRLCQQRNFFSLAPTQEFLGQLLQQFVAERADGPLLLEFMRYDWLRCGHRYLPSCLQLELAEDQPQAVKDALFQLSTVDPAGLFETLFEKGGRNHFFKTGFFLRFSGHCLRELCLSLGGAQGVVVFLSEKEESLYRLNKTIVLQDATIPHQTSHVK